MNDLCFVCSNRMSSTDDEYDPEIFEFCTETDRNLTKDGAIPAPKDWNDDNDSRKACSHFERAEWCKIKGE